MRLKGRRKSGSATTTSIHDKNTKIADNNAVDIGFDDVVKISRPVLDFLPELLLKARAMVDLLKLCIWTIDFDIEGPKI